MKKWVHSLTGFIFLLSLGCKVNPVQSSVPHVIVLGISQDGGAPHAGCVKSCCNDKWNTPNNRIPVSSLGIIDPVTNQAWLIDATPDFPKQVHKLTVNGFHQLKGIFLSHAHIGHYTGLMHLGREVMGAKNIPVFAMPRMKNYLESNGPWNQLVNLHNIKILSLHDGKAIQLNETIKITPFLVPHRDEYSETVGFIISGKNKTLVYIPDIDKWEKWDQDIGEWIQHFDNVLIDGTFFDKDEVGGRDMSEIPHPFIVESFEKFNALSKKEKSKIHFIHLNHTNPALKNNSFERGLIEKSGFNIAKVHQVFSLVD